MQVRLVHVLRLYSFQINKLEAKFNRQHTIHKEMQILYEEDKATLVDQHKRDEKALSEMQDRLCIIRRREQDLRDEYNEVCNNIFYGA